MSNFTRRRLAQTGAFAAGALLVPARAHAQTARLKIGVMSDMSGPYAEATGLGDVLATKFAIQDFTKLHPDIQVDLVSADMLLKPDVGASIARSWYDQEGVDAIFDIPQSAVALAVGQIAKEKEKTQQLWLDVDTCHDGGVLRLHCVDWESGSANCRTGCARDVGVRAGEQAAFAVAGLFRQPRAIAREADRETHGNNGSR